MRVELGDEARKWCAPQWFHRSVDARIRGVDLLPHRPYAMHSDAASERLHVQASVLIRAYGHMAGAGRSIA